MRRILLVCTLICFLSGCGPMGGKVFEDGMDLIGEEKEKPEADAQSEQEIAVSIDGSLQMDVPEGWEAFENPKPYDIYMTNSRAYTGVLVYDYSDLAENVEATDIFQYQISDLMSRRENVSVYQEEETNASDNRSITHSVYIGEKDLTKSIYYFSMVEFEGEEKFAVIIQTSLPDEFEKNLEDLDFMVESVRLTEENLSYGTGKEETQLEKP